MATPEYGQADAHETGARPSAIIDLSSGDHSVIQREDPADGEFVDLQSRFGGRDDEPITGKTAEQFAYEGSQHPERYRFLVDWLGQELAGVDPAYIADVGAGPAFLTNLIAKRWPRAHVLAVDVSPDMVDFARSYVADTNVRVVEGDVRRLSEIRDGPLDAIVSRRMIHRVDNLYQVLESTIRSLKPGGVLVNYSFRRPGVNQDRSAFLAAARMRSGQPHLYGAYARAVLNAPSLTEYGAALEEVAMRVGVQSVKLHVYPFDVGFIIRR